MTFVPVPVSATAVSRQREEKATAKLTVTVEEGRVRVRLGAWTDSAAPYSDDQRRRLTAHLSDALGFWETYLTALAARDPGAFQARLAHFPATIAFSSDPDTRLLISTPGDGLIEADDEFTTLPAILQALLLNHEANPDEVSALAADLQCCRTFHCRA